MTKDRARKKSIRARMAVSGEPYSVAARNLTAGPGDAAGAGDPGDGVAVAGEIVACAGRTLAERSARIAFRYDWDVSRAKPRAGDPARGNRARPLRRLAKLAGQAVWERILGGAELGHGAAEGFLEPAAGRYMIDFGSYAELGAGGVTFGGRPGRPVQGVRPSSKQEGSVLWLLRLLLGATDARLQDTETLRGTPCRKYGVRVEPARAQAASGAGLPAPAGVSARQPPVLMLTAWADGQHIRRVQFADRAPGDLPRYPGGAQVAKVLTLELWDFGAGGQELDWSRLPDFQTPR